MQCTPHQRYSKNPPSKETRVKTRGVSLIGCMLGIVLLAACNPIAPPIDEGATATTVAPTEPTAPSPPEVVAPTTTTATTTPPPEVKPTIPETTPSPEVTVPNAAGFVHPGVLVDINQLNMVRTKIANGEQPWTAAYIKMRDSGGSSATAARKHYKFSDLNYPPAAVSEVRCWAGTGMAYAQAHPELNLTESGCREQTDDAMAAYTQALMWYFTGNEAYAKKSIEIMNAWSYNLNAIPFDQPRTDKNQQIFGNGILQAAWTGQLMPRAAEIIRYTYNGWKAADVAKMESMLSNVIYPVIKNGWTGGANGLMSYPEAIMGIGVFTNNRAVFDSGVAMWRKNVKTIIYMPSDGSQPIAPHAMYAGSNTWSYWFKPTSYIAGLGGETGRDLSHTLMGFGAMSNGAATGSIQGVDLFGEEQARITAAYELHAGWVNQYLDEKARLGNKEPASSWRPSGWVNPNFVVGGTGYTGGWEVAYNHYAKKKSVAMPQTAKLINRLRPSSPNMTMIWETATHTR